jgi:ribosomal protein S25
MAREKVDLSSFTLEELTRVMAIRPSLMTEAQLRIYKKVKLENWLAKKDGKPNPWSFPSIRERTSTVIEGIQDISIQDLKREEQKKTPESQPTRNLVPVVTVDEEVEVTRPVFVNEVFNDKIPSWQKIPEKIDISDLIGRTITCKIKGFQQICKISVNEKNQIYLKSEKGTNCTVSLPHLYRAVHYATVLVNPPLAG